MKKAMKVMAAAMMAAVMSMGADAAAAEVQYDNFSLSNVLTDTEETSEEFIGYLGDETKVIDASNIGRGNLNARTPGYLYTWTIQPGTTHMSQAHYCTKGSQIKVSARILSGASTMVAGIREPDTFTRYITAATIDHRFNINETGYHSVFAQNKNSTAITVELIYYLL